MNDNFGAYSHPSGSFPSSGSLRETMNDYNKRTDFNNLGEEGMERIGDGADTKEGKRRAKESVDGEDRQQKQQHNSFLYLPGKSLHNTGDNHVNNIEVNLNCSS